MLCFYRRMQFILCRLSSNLCTGMNLGQNSMTHHTRTRKRKRKGEASNWIRKLQKDKIIHGNAIIVISTNLVKSSAPRLCRTGTTRLTAHGRLHRKAFLSIF